MCFNDTDNDPAPCRKSIVNEDQKHSLFTLLYAVVLIDNRVIRVEMDQFFITLEEFLTNVSFIDTLRAKSYISNWFVQNYKNILAEMKSPDRNIYLLKHAENLKHYEHRQIIFDMMMNIAIADNQCHALEKQFIEKVSEVWGLNQAGKARQNAVGSWQHPRISALNGRKLKAGARDGSGLLMCEVSAWEG